LIFEDQLPHISNATWNKQGAGVRAPILAPAGLQRKTSSVQLSIKPACAQNSEQQNRTWSLLSFPDAPVLVSRPFSKCGGLMRPFSMSLACPGILKPSRACKRGNKSEHLVSFVEISSKRKHRLLYLIMTCITPGIDSAHRSTKEGEMHLKNGH
jgi:hypothetical protein